MESIRGFLSWLTWFQKIIFQLESRWSATPISLGLSWSLTKKPPFGSVVVPSTFTTVYIDIYTSSFQLAQDCVIQLLYSVVVSIFFNFHPYLGKLPNLTNIFQLGWNHQPVLRLLSESAPPLRQVFRRGKSEEAVSAFSEEAKPMEVASLLHLWRAGGELVVNNLHPCTPPSTKTAIPEGSWGEGRVSKFKQDFRGNKKCIGGRELV